MPRLEQLKYNAEGLIPAVIQDFRTGTVLMVAYMDQEALKRTLESGKTWFWSRSRKQDRLKGETSGNYQEVKAVYYDCDADTLLIKVIPRGAGVACHTGSYSCFFNPLGQWEPSGEGEASPEILEELAEVIKKRRAERPPGSYVARLLEGGREEIARKLGEESLETLLAYLKGSREELAREAADLLFHLLVLLEEADLPPAAIWAELARRRKERG